jgi:hypothetical protein
MNVREPWVRSVLLGVSAILYCVSLTQLAFCVEGNCKGNAHSGLAVLLTGWTNTLLILQAPFAGFAWLANPLLLFTWVTVLAAYRRLALPFACTAFAFGLGILFRPEILISESGNTSPITPWGPGYWFWLGSLTLALLSAWLIPKPEEVAEP